MKISLNNVTIFIIKCFLDGKPKHTPHKMAIPSNEYIASKVPNVNLYFFLNK